MLNFMRDVALIDSDDIPTRLVHKMSPSLPQSAQFVALPNPSVEHKPSNFSMGLLSTMSFKVKSSPEVIHIKFTKTDAVINSLPQECAIHDILKMSVTSRRRSLGVMINTRFRHAAKIRSNGYLSRRVEIPKLWDSTPIIGRPLL
ncbi:hypothetical protein ACTXT7_002343 [Hymenolepis weldensis]